jgi:hypothetical protein
MQFQVGYKSIGAESINCARCIVRRHVDINVTIIFASQKEYLTCSCVYLMQILKTI